VGVLLFEMLTGKKPFVAEKIAELMLMHRESPPPTLRATVPDAGISGELEAVVARALAKIQEDRFQSAEEFAVALDRVPEARAPRSFGAAKTAAQAVAPGSHPAQAAAPAQVGDGEATIIDPIVMRSSGGSPREPPAEKPAAGGVSGQAGRRRDVRRWLGLGGMAAVAIALVVLGVAQRPGPGSAPKTAPASGAPASAARAAPGSQAAGPGKTGKGDDAPAGAAVDPAAADRPPAPPGPSVAQRLADADRLVAAGEWEQALVVLDKARRDDPQNVETAYRLANVYFENKRYGEGVAPARLAGRDVRFRGDERLVKNLIRSLGSDRSYDRSAEVLRGFGAPAVPFLKEAAAGDKNPQVRQRAAEILQPKGRVSARGTGSRPSSSGGRSIFQR
jgi:eukaryotic-like serine/threonine-protein kinase